MQRSPFSSVIISQANFIKSPRFPSSNVRNILFIYCTLQKKKSAGCDLHLIHINQSINQLILLMGLFLILVSIILN